MMNWKGFGRKRYYPDIRLEGLRESIRKTSVMITFLWAEN
jgi:hypothetical protein